MIARPVMRRAFVATTAVSLVIFGFGLAVVATDPKPEIKTVYPAIAPACEDAIHAAELAVTHDGTADQHETAAVVATEGLMPALLAGDADTVTEISATSEREKRLAAAAQTKRDTARTEFEQAAADCLPEVDR